MECERVYRVTPAQQKTLRELETSLIRCVQSLKDGAPHEPTWHMILTRWRRKVYLGTARLHVPEYTPLTGCLTLGLDANGSRDMVPRLFGRCLMTLVKESIGNSACSQQMRTALEHALEIGIEVDLSCDDIKEFGLVRHPLYKKKRCHTDAYDRRRATFEELLGRDVDDAVRMMRRGYPDLHIVTRPWDLLHQAATYDMHPEKETLIISYDMKSNKVVLPEPRITSLQNMEGADGACFLLPDEDGARCLGAPRIAPKEWDQLLGQNLMNATDSLRFKYPHAMVQTHPDTYGIPPTKRRDRIRVVYDPSTAKTTHIMLG